MLGYIAVLLRPGLERMKLDFVGITIDRVPECLARILLNVNVKSIDTSTDSLYNIHILNGKAVVIVTNINKC